MSFKIYPGQSVVRSCYKCRIKFAAIVFKARGGKHYVKCPQCGKMIAVKSVSKTVSWPDGKITKF